MSFQTNIIIDGDDEQIKQLSEQQIDIESICQELIAKIMPLDGWQDDNDIDFCLELSILLCGKKQISEFNQQYRNKDYATNILSFAQYSPEELNDIKANYHNPQILSQKHQIYGNNIILGDLALCYDVVTKEATEQNKKVNNHLTHILLHGILHLLGYDHENTKDAEIMENLEIQILSHFSIENPYQNML